MKTESWILVIGAGAIVGWYVYNRNKSKTNAVVAAANGGANMQPPVSVEVEPKTAFHRPFRVVMPSDLVSPSVRAKAQDLTDRRYSVDTSKLK